MIRIIKFASGPVARFPLTPSIISQIPGWEDMILQHGSKKFDICDVRWPSFGMDPEEAMELCDNNWDTLVNTFISDNYDLPSEQLVIISRFAPYVLESRVRHLKKYTTADVYTPMSRMLKLYCPMSVAGRKNKDEFDRWIVV